MLRMHLARLLVPVKTPLLVLRKAALPPVRLPPSLDTALPLRGYCGEQTAGKNHMLPIWSLAGKELGPKD